MNTKNLSSKILAMSLLVIGTDTQTKQPVTIMPPGQRTKYQENKIIIQLNDPRAATQQELAKKANGGIRNFALTCYENQGSKFQALFNPHTENDRIDQEALDGSMTRAMNG